MESKGSKLIWSTATCGELLRRINAKCAGYVELGDMETAKKYATIARQVREAMKEFFRKEELGSTATCGELLRRINAKCAGYVDLGDMETAKKYATIARQVREAMKEFFRKEELE